MLRRKPPKIITRSTTAAAAKSLVDNDDLLLDIFLRLPIRSLLRFKSVSKRWLSLISNPNFCHRRSAIQPLTPPSVILFRPYCSRFSPGSDLDYMDPNAPRVPYRSLEPTISECRIVILQSCNGLFLGRSCEKNVYYVYNPTTEQYKKLPMLQIIKNRVTLYLNLAYDPLRSPNYEVVCFRVVDSTNYQIKIYSSDSGFCRTCCEGSFADRFIKEIDRGVYGNGAVHWVRDCEKGIYFDLSEEKLHELPIPGASNDRGHKIVKYFGGCCGHLYWVEGVELEPMELIVYEMEDDHHCGWFVTYRVDLKWVWRLYQNPGSGGMEALYSKFTVLAIVDQSEVGEEEACVVFLCRNIFRVNAKSGRFETDGYINIGRTTNTPHGFRTIEALLYIEGLACV